VRAGPGDQDDLAEWANEFLYWFETDEYEDRWREAAARQEREVGQLRPLVGPYRHDPGLPPLPDPPDGQLHGVGFIYDEDRDDRVLVAIDKLKDNPDLVALAEHEGGLKIYARLPFGKAQVDVCDDVWVIEEFVPYRGRWVEATPEFVRDCLARGLGHPDKPWQGEQPTLKQLAYLRALGYDGPEPRTKGEAGALIAEWKSRKGTG
jgi:hypothetical protein